MSALSDALAASMQDPTAKPKPKAPPKATGMTLEQATALAKKRNPLATLAPGDVGLGLEAQRQQRERGRTPLDAGQLHMGVAGMNARGDRAARGMASAVATQTAPERDVLAKASNLFEAPFSLAGAEAQDVAEGRGDPFTAYPDSAVNHTLALMGKGQFGAAREHSFTSWPEVRRLAKDGNPLAKWALQHPSLASVGMGAAEFANPSNVVGGRVAELLGAGAKAGLTAGGRAASRAVRALAPDKAAVVGHPLYRLSQALGEASTLSRMAAVRQAAADEAPRVGLSPKVAADRADLIGRKMAQSTETAKAAAQQVTKDVFGGLTPEQQLEVMDEIERRPSSLPPSLVARLAAIKPGEGALDTSKGFAHGPLEPQGPSTVPDLARRVQAYRTWRGAIDSRTIGNGLAEPGELWTGEHYFPRKGMTSDPAVEESEEQDALDEQLESRRSRGGQNIRRDTLNKNIPSRKYESRREAIAGGVKLDPEWTPAEALYRHAISRERNNILEEGAHGLAELGLAEPLETETKNVLQQPAIAPFQKAMQKGRHAPTDVSTHRKDYLPFTQLGNVRQFGSPLFKGSAVHPAVADLIEDLAGQARNGGLPSAIDAPASALGAVNSAAARLEVSQPFYHVPVNVVPGAAMSMLTHGVDAPALVKALVRPKAAIADAQAAGADFPYADPEFKTTDLDPRMTVGKAARSVPRAVNAASSKLLYKYMQPYVAGAMFKGLEKPMGREAAALDVRSALGEPENMGAREKQLSQEFIFPSWQKSQLRRAVALLSRNPALYQASHTAVNARNESRGVSPEAYSWQSLVPPIVTGVGKNGAVHEIPVPGPFNRVLGIVDALGNAATGEGNAKTMIRDVLNTLNPALGFAARVGATQLMPAQDPSGLALFDRDAPRGEQGSQLLQSFLQRYNPDRGATDPKSAALGLLGIEPETQLSSKESKKGYAWEQRVRGAWPKRGDPPNVEELRQLATKARGQGGTITIYGKRYTAGELDARADRLYDWMEKKMAGFKAKESQ